MMGVKGELARMRKEAFTVMSQHMPGGTEENFKKPPPDFRSKF